MHKTAGRSLLYDLSGRINYSINPDKTEGGTLITSYACDYRTADNEFFLSKMEYALLTGREEKHNVIAYQVRQSFKPGEVSAEEANRIGYDFAARFLKGKHAFLVCTHTDKSHIHNHIIWNSTTLDCKRKFRDFLGSGKAVARLSDLICEEHRLSVISKTGGRGVSYNKWLVGKAKPSHREILRQVIDSVLKENPADFDSFICRITEQGYSVKLGKNISFSHPSFKKNIRMSSLGRDYTEEDIRAYVSGDNRQRKKGCATRINANFNRAVIDIEQKLAQGKGEGYRRWATVENLKRMAKTKLYMDEHGVSFDDLDKRKSELEKQKTELSEKLSQTQTRLTEINILKTHIINYTKTRDVFRAYKESGYSKKFYLEHESDIIIHRAAKRAFNEMKIKKLPTVKNLQKEFAQLLREKKNTYKALKETQNELRAISIHRENYRELCSAISEKNKNERS